MAKSTLPEVVAALRAIGDETRLRIVCALRRQPMCVCQIVELAQLAPSTVSEHLAVLKAEGICTSRKEGRWIFYRLAEEHAVPGVPEVVDGIVRTLESDRALRADAERLARIVRIDPAELCRRQKSAGGNCCGRKLAKVR